MNVRNDINDNISMAYIQNWKREILNEQRMWRGAGVRKQSKAERAHKS